MVLPFELSWLSFGVSVFLLIWPRQRINSYRNNERNKWIQQSSEPVLKRKVLKSKYFHTLSGTHTHRQLNMHTLIYEHIERSRWIHYYSAIHPWTKVICDIYMHIQRTNIIIYTICAHGHIIMCILIVYYYSENIWIIVKHHKHTQTHTNCMYVYIICILNCVVYCYACVFVWFKEEENDPPAATAAHCWMYSFLTVAGDLTTHGKNEKKAMRPTFHRIYMYSYIYISASWLVWLRACSLTATHSRARTHGCRIIQLQLLLLLSFCCCYACCSSMHRSLKNSCAIAIPLGLFSIAFKCRIENTSFFIYGPEKIHVTLRANNWIIFHSHSVYYASSCTAIWWKNQH